MAAVSHFLNTMRRTFSWIRLVFRHSNESPDALSCRLWVDAETSSHHVSASSTSEADVIQLHSRELAHPASAPVVRARRLNGFHVVRPGRRVAHPGEWVIRSFPLPMSQTQQLELPLSSSRSTAPEAEETSSTSGLPTRSALVLHVFPGKSGAMHHRTATTVHRTFALPRRRRRDAQK